MRMGVLGLPFLFVAKGNLEKYADFLGNIKYLYYNKNSERASVKARNGEVPPGQNVDEDGNIVNNDGNTPPGLNRRKKADKPENPNKLLNNDHGNYVYATYTGHIFDTTLDIYFAEARFYDANTRTWLAMDPIKSGGNWYQYCYSSPVVYYDPDGESALAILALLAKPVLAALGGMAIGGVVGAGSTLITELTDEAPGVNWRTVGENALRVAGDGGFLGIAYYISPISATIGLGSQFVADMIAGGQLSSLESYTGSAFGSSIGNP